MPNNWFDIILTDTIKHFKRTYSETSEELFKDTETGKYFHNGEFGVLKSFPK